MEGCIDLFFSLTERYYFELNEEGMDLFQVLGLKMKWGHMGVDFNNRGILNN
jgi:hypothetical protein